MRIRFQAHVLVFALFSQPTGNQYGKLVTFFSVIFAPLFWNIHEELFGLSECQIIKRSWYCTDMIKRSTHIRALFENCHEFYQLADVIWKQVISAVIAEKQRRAQIIRRVGLSFFLWKYFSFPRVLNHTKLSSLHKWLWDVAQFTLFETLNPFSR